MSGGQALHGNIMRSIGQGCSINATKKIPPLDLHLPDVFVRSCAGIGLALGYLLRSFSSLFLSTA